MFEMPSRQPTHHGYAVNVKDDELYSDHEPLSDAEAQRIYDGVVETFWDQAELVAQDHGFQGVYSEGAGGGWAGPYPQPATDDMWEHELAAWVRDRFRPFELDILALMSGLLRPLRRRAVRRHRARILGSPRRRDGGLMPDFITAQDLRYALEDLIPDNADRERIRDARRAATVLTPEDVKSAVITALNTRLAETRPEP